MTWTELLIVFAAERETVGFSRGKNETNKKNVEMSNLTRPCSPNSLPVCACT